MTQNSHFRKDEPIWWNISASNNRPKWAPKRRNEQAGWVKGFDEKGEMVVIEVWDCSRNPETYMVPIEQIRPRSIT